MRPSSRSGSGWKAVPKVWEGFGIPRGRPGGVGRPSRRSERSRKDLAQVREGSG